MNRRFESVLLNLPRYSQLGNAAMKPGLRGVGHLLRAMGHPERAVPCVHVAGTNGKGSTAALLAAIAQACGHRVGLYTSPHLVRLTERIRVNGRPASDQWMDHAVRRYGALLDALQPSFFEGMTALAFLHFAESSLDLAVIETGLGGRLDATNVVQPELSVITSIDLDHTATLGNNIAAIAAEKGGIIKPGIPVLARPGHLDAQGVLEKQASKRGAPWLDTGSIEVHNHGFTLCTPIRTYTDLRCGLPGAHQAANALLAVRAAEHLFPSIQEDLAPVHAGISRVVQLSGLLARLQVIQTEPLIVLDVAHNAAAIAAALHHMPRYGRLHVLLALMVDKDLTAIAAQLRRRNCLVHACALDTPRAWSATALADALREEGVDVADAGSAPAQWERMRTAMREDECALVCGSHRLAGAVLATFGARVVPLEHGSGVQRPA